MTGAGRRRAGIGRRARTALAATAAAALLAGCGGGSSGDGGPPGDAASPAASAAATETARSGPVSPKHARLLQIAAQLRESSNVYFGLQPGRALDAIDTTGLSTTELAELDFRKAMSAFQFGDAERAESLFERSIEREPGTFARYMLGVTQLRIGELRNCLENHNAESCVFPIAGGGVHLTADPAERALRTLLDVLPETPRRFRPKVRWFATIAAMALGRYPDGLAEDVRVPPEAFASAYDIGRFPDVAMQLGVAEKDLDGSVVMEDLDGDGLLDLVTSTTALEGQMRYFHNEGDGTFADRTEEAGLLGQIGGLNMVHADYDNDGNRDILVLRGGWLGTHGRMPNSLLRNRGDGTFEDVTDRAGIGRVDYPCQTAAFADYDLDGDLDLFLGNETPPPASGQRYPCELFRNEGDGTFTEVTEEAGLQVYKLVKGVTWGDWDGDRDPDLFVSDQFDSNRFFRNEGDGTFTDIAEELGLDEPKNSFSAWTWDYDNDGGLDLFVAGYGGSIDDFVKSYIRGKPGPNRCALFHNEDGRLVDRGMEAGLTLQSLTMGAAWGDLDNDGWPDFYLGTGAPDFDVLIPSLMYRNDGSGRFQDVTESGGFGNLQKGHGIAFGDLDNDGDQDVYAQIGGMYPYDDYFNSLFLNPGHGNRWISLELVGTESNRDALGSRITVRVTEDGKPRRIVRWVWPRGSFGSGTFRQEIGLGKAERVDSVEVWWPKTDRTQRFEDLAPDAFYRITEGSAAPERLERKAVRLAVDAMPAGHMHH